MVVDEAMVVLLYNGFEEFDVAVAFFFVLAENGNAVGCFKLVVAVAVGDLPTVVGVAEGTGAEADGVGVDAEVVGR